MNYVQNNGLMTQYFIAYIIFMCQITNDIYSKIA